MEIAIVFLLAVVVAFVAGRASVKAKTVTVTEYVPIESEPREPRYLLTWKTGSMKSNDSAVVSAKIGELRAANQPYEAYFDKKQIHPRPEKAK